MTVHQALPQPTRRSLAYAAAALFILAVGISLFFLGQRRGAVKAPDVATRLDEPEIVDARTGTATLFFVAENGMALVEYQQQVEIAAADDSLTLARIILEHQLGDTPAPLESPFPENTELLAVYLTPNGNAFVDLSREVTREHGGGSLNELFTVYAVVNALTANMSEISAVQILIEGREVDTLAGHIDLRRPLQRNMKWVAGTSSDTESESSTDEE